MDVLQKYKKYTCVIPADRFIVNASRLVRDKTPFVSDPQAFYCQFKKKLSCKGNLIGGISLW